MARTRAQDAARSEDGAEGSKPQGHAKATAGDNAKATGRKDKKRKVNDVEKANDEKANDEQAPASKKSKTEGVLSPEDTKSVPSAIDKSKLDALLSSYGVHPLQDTSLPKANEPTPETVLALLYLAMLSSARISHELAYKSLQCLIEAGYQDVKTLKKSTWQERTEVLTKGGYTRYREKTATALGELADLIGKEYGTLNLQRGSCAGMHATDFFSRNADNDLNNVLKKADSSPTGVRKLLQEIKGFGKVGTDIFFDCAQGVWPSLAPFIDPRSMETAKRCGLGGDVEAMWDAVGKDAVEMCKLSSALTKVRLEKKEKEFQ